MAINSSLSISKNLILARGCRHGNHCNAMATHSNASYLTKSVRIIASANSRMAPKCSPPFFQQSSFWKCLKMFFFCLIILNIQKSLCNYCCCCLQQVDKATYKMLQPMDNDPKIENLCNNYNFRKTIKNNLIKHNRFSSIAKLVICLCLVVTSHGAEGGRGAWRRSQMVVTWPNNSKKWNRCQRHWGMWSNVKPTFPNFDSSSSSSLI